MDREEEKQRKAFMDAQRQENEAPKKGIKDMYDKVRDMFGLGNEKPVKKAKGGKVGSASKRGDGIAQRGKTKGRMI